MKIKENFKKYWLSNTAKEWCSEILYWRREPRTQTALRNVQTGIADHTKAAKAMWVSKRKLP